MRAYGTGCLRKRGGRYWHARWFDENGLRHSRSLKTSSKREAEEILAQIIATCNAGGGYTVVKVGTIYFVQGNTSQNIKIGFTAHGVVYRQQALDEPTTLLRLIAGTFAVERQLHFYFRAYRVAGTREWFTPAPAVLEFIRNTRVLEVRSAAPVDPPFVENRAARLLRAKPEKQENAA